MGMAIAPTYISLKLTQVSDRTVSVKNRDGTFEQIARVDGSPEYISFMQYLATSPVERMTDGNRIPPGVDEKTIYTSRF
jgi:hypothetical protein